MWVKHNYVYSSSVLCRPYDNKYVSPMESVEETVVKEVHSVGTIVTGVIVVFLVKGLTNIINFRPVVGIETQF